MPKSRKSLVSLDAPPIIIASLVAYTAPFFVVRMALTGQNFEHRRQWIEDRLLELPSNFAINIAAYTVMSNTFPCV